MTKKKKTDISSNTKFCHFTSVKNARDLLNGRCFYLSKYDHMNDLAEAALHGEDKDRVFALSFSNSEAMNIPEFYLYGGIDGKGCRIEFTDAKVREIINNCHLYYVNKQNRRLRKIINPNTYMIKYDWIYYIAQNGYCEHRKDKLSFNSFQNAVDYLKQRDKHYFIKSPIWKFEKEFRIVVVFKDIVTYERIAMSFDIKQKERGISVTYGPETSDEEYNEIRQEFSEYGINNGGTSSQFAISMNLIERNRDLIKR